MVSFSAILLASAPVFIAVGIGLILRRKGLLTPAMDQSLMAVVINVLYPSLILFHLLRNPALRQVDVIVTAVGLGFLLLAVSVAFCYAVAPLLGLQRGSGRRTFPLVAGIQNYGFFPIPIFTTLLADSPDRLGIILGLLFLFSLGLEIGIWTVGVAMLSGSIRGSWKRLINGPMIAIIIGLTLNASGAIAFIPTVVDETLSLLGAAAIPFSLLLVGASLGDLLSARDWRHSWRVPVGGTVLRMGLLPFLFFGCALWLPIDRDLKLILVIQGAMPSAMFPIVMAKHYGGHVSTAIQVVVTTTLLAVVLIPLLILVGLRLTGLDVR